MKYTRRIGQKTGTSKTLNQVMTNAIVVACIAWYQNLNSGTRLVNGLRARVEGSSWGVDGRIAGEGRGGKEKARAEHRREKKCKDETGASDYSSNAVKN